MILHIGRVILVIIEVLVIFNLLIVVHELGHFLAARWRGLYIEKFGVWFGQPLWKKTINGVQYSLGSLPFGGLWPCRSARRWTSSKAKRTWIVSSFRRSQRSP